MRTREPEKYYARSRCSAHVPARLGTSVGGRWDGTGRDGKGREGRGKGGRGEKVEIAGTIWAISTDFRRLASPSYWSFPAESRSLSFSLRTASAKNPRERPRRRRGSADPSRIRWWTPDTPWPRHVRSASIFPRFFFYPATRLAVPANRRARGRSIVPPCNVLRERPFWKFIYVVYICDSTLRSILWCPREYSSST